MLCFFFSFFCTELPIFCTKLPYFCIVFPKNCIILSQSQSRNFCMYIIRRIINTVVSICLQKYARIFVLGHYLFLEAHSFPRASLSENCSLLGTDNVRGQISVHIFAPNGDYYLYNPKGTRDNKILKCSCARASVWKMLLVTSQSVFCKDLKKYVRHSTNQRFDDNGCAFKNTFTARCTCFL